MSNPFFDQPILNSPYNYPVRHWELDSTGQPTQKIIDARRQAEFISPIPKPKKRRAKPSTQQELAFQDEHGISDEKQQYEVTSTINEVRRMVDLWRKLPNPSQWNVTPETARLLQHWRSLDYTDVRPFFCQIEATEVAIWLVEVAPKTPDGRRLLKFHLQPHLTRIQL